MSQAGDDFRKRLKESMKQNRQEFNEIYKDELLELKGLSDDQIAAIVPAGTSSEEYKKLTEVVEQASRDNLSKAELKKKIEDLGLVTVQIAKKVPKIAALFC